MRPTPRSTSASMARRVVTSDPSTLVSTSGCGNGTNGSSDGPDDGDATWATAMPGSAAAVTPATTPRPPWSTRRRDRPRDVTRGRPMPRDGRPSRDDLDDAHHPGILVEQDVAVVHPSARE